MQNDWLECNLPIIICIFETQYKPPSFLLLRVRPGVVQVASVGVRWCSAMQRVWSVQETCVGVCWCSVMQRVRSVQVTSVGVCWCSVMRRVRYVQVTSVGV